MSRARFNFRPSLQLDSHLRAWESLQSVPDGQRNDFLVRAILRMQEDTVLEETLRRVLHEELQALPSQLGPVPERAEEDAVPEASFEQAIPQEMLGFLADLMGES